MKEISRKGRKERKDEAAVFALFAAFARNLLRDCGPMLAEQGGSTPGRMS